MKLVVSVLSAVIPSLFLLLYFYKRDLNPEPRGTLLWTFILGFAAVVPVMIVIYPLSQLDPDQAGPMLSGLYFAFVCTAIPEEFFKCLVIAWCCARSPAFDEPMDGVVYGATASLGFATFENIVYVISGGWTVALYRSFTAVLSHACLGAILGYYIGQARLSHKPKYFVLLGLLITIILHGLYDFPLVTIQSLNGRADLHNAAPAEMGIRLGLFLLFATVLLTELVWTIMIVRRLHHEQTIDAES